MDKEIASDSFLSDFGPDVQELRNWSDFHEAAAILGLLSRLVGANVPAKQVSLFCSPPPPPTPRPFFSNVLSNTDRHHLHVSSPSWYDSKTPPPPRKGGDVNAVDQRGKPSSTAPCWPRPLQPSCW
eukprot:762937-Hanusia_phi.AAC.1